MTKLELLKKLKAIGMPSQLIDKCTRWMQILEDDIDFFSDKWNVLRWKRRPGNARYSNVLFSSISNLGLRAVAKAYILNKRWKSNICDATAVGDMRAIKKLDEILGSKSIMQVNNGDFEIAVGNNVNLQKKLFNFGSWLRINLGLRISYKALATSTIEHGRDGTEEGRRNKLIPIEVMRDFFGLASNESLAPKDRFFINAIVLNSAMGGRVGELASLPVDCLVFHEGAWVLRLFPEKVEGQTLRLFPQDLLPAVKSAVEFLKNLTVEGRRIARKRKESSAVDWYKVWKSPEATEYYARRFCHEWTTSFSIFTPDAVWVSKRNQFIDFVGVQRRLGINGGAKYVGVSARHFKRQVNRQMALKEGVYYSFDSNWRSFPVTLDTPNWREVLLVHPHSVSFNRFEQFYQMRFRHHKTATSIVRKIFDVCLSDQLLKKSFPFTYDSNFEGEFHKQIEPVIRDGTGAVLEVEDALMVLPRFFFHTSFNTDLANYTMVSRAQFCYWLADAAKGLDSVFSKYNVIDPRTGNVATFTWHDIRHWLNTVYKQGGLTDLQVNALLSRKSLAQARVYDQTLAIDRSKVVQDLLTSIRQDKAIGQIQETYNILGMTDRQTAEQYLKAAVRIVNPMPHGGCTLDLALKTCRHSLSCLSVNERGDCCESLVVDVENEGQFIELKKINDDANTIREYIQANGGEGGHQDVHFSRVARSTARLLEVRQLK